MHFFVYKYRLVVYDYYGYGENDVKEQFLKAKIFDCKSFGEVEKELAWYDES